MVFSFPGGSSGRAAKPLRGPAELRAYWEGLRRGGGIPSRADLDPRGIAGVLDRVFVGERIGTGLIRLRIAGTALTDISGLEMKGLPLSVLFLPEARARLAEVLERVLVAPQAAELHLEAERSIGRPALSGRHLLLPLQSNGGARDLVLGCLATEGETGRAPRRFAIARAVEEALVPPEARPLPHRSLPGRPHLRLVHSAD